ncbi:MAG: ATP-binding protein [Gammaproteobacteria bacterium]
MAIAYRRLYLRMVVYIGAALIAFILLGVISLFLIASYELRGYVTARQSPLAEEAAAVLATGGKPALQNWLRQQQQISQDFTIYVLDAQSRDLLERQLPSQLEGFVKESVVGTSAEPAGNLLPVRLTPQLLAPDGSILSFLLLPKSITLWGSNLTRLALFAAALLVAGVVAWLIARAFGRPIGELQQAARELAVGHVDARVPEVIARRRDELGILAADFNTMAERLEQLISGREQLMQEMSHELRSPLARLQAALALANHRQSLTSAEREQIDTEIARMDQAIGEMLKFSHVDSGGKLAKRLVHLDRLLADLVDTQEVEAAAKNCRIELHTAQAMTLVGDPKLLRSGFENILRNAIRHTPADSIVEVNARPEGETLLVDISDSGPGVSAADLSRIFEPFFRAADTAGESQGSGLGLAIAQRVFQAHKGSIHAAARPGGGLTVSVELPGAGSG